MVTHFDATLGMGGWLDLTQQGLSPCKKYRASWRSRERVLVLETSLQKFQLLLHVQVPNQEKIFH